MSGSADSPSLDLLLDALAARGVAVEPLRPIRDLWQLHTGEIRRTWVRRGQRAQALFFLLAGELSVRVQKVEVGRLEAGALVGLVPCITKAGTYPDELFIVARAVIAELPAEALLALRREGDRAYDALLGLELRTLAERMAHADARHSALRLGTVGLQTRSPATVFGRLWRSFRGRGGACPPIGPLLRGLPGLRDASEAVIGEIGAAFTPRSFAAHEVIAHEGEAENSLYLVADGQVDVLRKAKNGAWLMLAALRERSLFGMVSLLSGSPRIASCVAASEAKVYEMTRDAYAAMGPHAGRAWRECLVAVLHRQLRDTHRSLASAIRVFEASGSSSGLPRTDQSLVMFVTGQREPDGDDYAE